MERAVILPLPLSVAAPRPHDAVPSAASVELRHTRRPVAEREAFAALCRSVAGGDSHAAPAGRRWLRPDW